MEPTREELEEFLRRSRPLPRTEFVRDLEESLARSLKTLGCSALVEPRRALKLGRHGRA